jgi:alpha-L-rhamnosidase
MPWDLYRSYGDVDILRRQFSRMLAWIDRGIRRGSDGLCDSTPWQLGDWLDPTTPPIEPGDSRTNETLVPDTFLVNLTSTMVQICQVFGKVEDAARFQRDVQRLKTRFQEKYIAPSGLLVGYTQTALWLAIIFDLHATPEQSKTASPDLLIPSDSLNSKWPLGLSALSLSHTHLKKLVTTRLRTERFLKRTGHLGCT